MWKYYAFLFTVLAAVLWYTFVADPCNRQFRADFARAHPDYVILETGPEKGSPESVQCHVVYRKPGDDAAYEDIWLYQNLGTAWEFAKAIETGKRTDAR